MSELLKLANILFELGIPYQVKYSGESATIIIKYIYYKMTIMFDDDGEYDGYFIEKI